MNGSILELVIRQLQDAGFSAFHAYPGQKAPEITEPVAAVHIHKADSGSQTVTVEVTLLSPAKLGGTACELAARRAASALLATKAVCVQNGCVYDSVGQQYTVSVLATYSAECGEDSCQLGPGFQISLDGVQHPSAVSFTEEKVQKQTVEYATRVSGAVAITAGSYFWNIQLEELVPAGFSETELPDGEFVLQAVRGSKAHTYSPCRWSSVTRSYGPQGLRIVCKGVALNRKEHAV